MSAPLSFNLSDLVQESHFNMGLRFLLRDLEHKCGTNANVEIDFVLRNNGLDDAAYCLRFCQYGARDCDKIARAAVQYCIESTSDEYLSSVRPLVENARASHSLCRHVVRLSTRIAKVHDEAIRSRAIGSGDVEHREEASELLRDALTLAAKCGAFALRRNPLCTLMVEFSKVVDNA